MISDLIEGGWSLADIDSLTMEELEDIINAKAKLKESKRKKKEAQEAQISPENSMEAMLKSAGLL